MGTIIFVASVIVLMTIFFLVELRTGPKRQNEALYLVSRVGERYGFEVKSSPLSLVIPWSHDETILHYHLLRPGGERDSITLISRRGAKSRLGNLVIANDPRRISAAGLEYLSLATPQLDRCFRIFVEPDRKVLLLNLLEQSHEILSTLQDLSCRSRGGRFEFVDHGGQIKIQVHDKSLRFPSDVERATLDLVRFYQQYLVLSGVCDVRSVPAAASPVTPL